MILNYKLSRENKELCRLEHNEKICYCLPLDIDIDGIYRNNSFTVITQKRIIILEEGTVTKTYELADCELVQSEPQIACGILYVVRQGMEEYVGRFSAKHLTRYSYISRGCKLLGQERQERVISTEYESTCPKCGRGLPGTKNCPKCGGKKEGFWVSFMDMLSTHKMRLFIIIIFMFAATIVTLAGPAVLRYLVDDVLIADKSNYKKAIICLILMFLMGFGIMFINSIKSYLCIKLGSIIGADLRKKLYNKIQMLSLSFINERSPGELINRVVQDTNRVKDFMGDTFCNMFTIIIIFTCDVIYMLILNWKMACIAFAFVPLAVGLSFSFRKNIRSRFHMQRAKSDKVNSNLQDVISGMAVVKSYGQEKRESDFFNKAAEDYARVERGNEIFFALLYPLLSFLLGVGIYLITYFGGVSTIKGNMTPGELLQYISYTSLLYTYVGWITNMPRMFMNMVTSVERINDVMNQEPRIFDVEDAQTHQIDGEIEFRHASFGYKSYQPVLEDINLKIHKGEMIGLVGASGTGKSTMINLIMHLYEVDDGMILIDGINIRDIKLENYHSQIGVVLQETFLFSGTILNNLLFAKPEASLEEIIYATKMANAHDFICKMQDGYNTYVGEHGYNLSGGERQRIAIARAILNQPKILILDEATASLDTESEYLIQKALLRLTKGRTTFAIAHRLSTLKDANRIVVIDGHKIAEVGSHNELVEKKGIYYGLVNAQLRMQKKAD
ncbi:MAG TPA: ABC transporter ATP-binding protein [Lachnospiraceae bacterium]|nr:ABC transporter ATP-binding protein [Lachnospiraceae bacterium]